MKPAYTIIRHVNSNRSFHTPAAMADHNKGRNHFTYQCIREFPREVDLKRAARARKRQEKANLATA